MTSSIAIILLVLVGFAAGCLCGVAYLDSLMWRVDEGSDE